MIDTLNIDSYLFKLAISLYGEDGQIDQTQEECAELIVALNHYRRNRITVEDLAGEIADVYIMCQQMAEIIGVEFVDQKVIEKSKRLRDRLERTINLIPKEPI